MSVRLFSVSLPQNPRFESNMITTVFRQSSSMAAVKRSLKAAKNSVATTILHHRLPLAVPTRGFVVLRNGGTSGYIRALLSDGGATTDNSPFYNGGRGFHGKCGPLGFRSTLVAESELALDAYDSCDEDGGVADVGRSSGGDGLEISSLGISNEIVAALSRRGITKLFPIQKAVLEPAMEGRDMIGRARTGTGKTLAFGIPIMDKITRLKATKGLGRNPLCLVLAPTRELARQVEKEFSDSAPSLDTICVYGGTPIGNQIRNLGRGVNVAVGTPGRIIDLLKRGALNLSEVQFVVLDEADQMLQVGFAEDVEIILQKLPRKRQSMMFSATMPSWIISLTRKYLKDPLTVDLVGNSDQKLADGISLYSIVTDRNLKASIIGPLVAEHAKGGKCIIFTQTKRDADRLSHALARKYKCEALHGDISQSQRERTLAGFRDGRFDMLVATDVAARGLDVPSVDLVIHYELPNNSEIFVHRTGRTGRAGKKGSAIIIYTRDQSRTLKQYEREVGCRFSELPKIAGDGATLDMERGRSSAVSRYGDSPKSRSSSGSRYGDSGFSRSSSRDDFSTSRFRSSSSPKPTTRSSRGGGSSFFDKEDDYKSDSYGSNKFGSTRSTGRSSRGGGSFFDVEEEDSDSDSYGSGRSSYGKSSSGRYGKSDSRKQGRKFGSGRSSY